MSYGEPKFKKWPKINASDFSTWYTVTYYVMLLLLSVSLLQRAEKGISMDACLVKLLFPYTISACVHAINYIICREVIKMTTYTIVDRNHKLDAS